MSDHEKLREAISTYRDWRALRSGIPAVTIMDHLERIVSAAESTLPKTKMVEVWAVMGWDPETKTVMVTGRYCLSDAEGESDSWRIHFKRQYVHVTGPHQQEVPC